MPKYKITFTNEINTSVQNGDNLYLRIFAADAVKDNNNIEVTSAVTAVENILCIFTTLDVFHDPISWLNAGTK